jgi:hypothetical protein
MTETDETMIKRLRMRSMRRGIKEMDLILQDFATRELDAMDPNDRLHTDLLLPLRKSVHLHLIIHCLFHVVLKNVVEIMLIFI